MFLNTEMPREIAHEGEALRMRLAEAETGIDDELIAAHASRHRPALCAGVAENDNRP